MNTGQIETSLKHIKSFLGVFPSNKIPSVRPTKDPQCFIANLDPSWKPGSHWIAICVRKIKEKNVLEYFDSYGLFPPVKLDKKRWKVIRNKHQFQKLGSAVCGHYAVFFVKNRLKGKSFKSILNTLKKQSDADGFVRSKIKIEKVLGVGQCCSPATRDWCSVCKLWNLVQEP